MKRYDINLCSSETYQGLVEDTDGDLVLYEDVKRLEQLLSEALDILEFHKGSSHSDTDDTESELIYKIEGLLEE